MDFYRKLIFAGLGTHRLCLLYANKYLRKTQFDRSGYPSAVLAQYKNQSLGNRSFAGVSGHRMCLLTAKTKLRRNPIFFRVWPHRICLLYRKSDYNSFSRIMDKLIFSSRSALLKDKWKYLAVSFFVRSS